jgi:hypothetical protein
MQPLPDLCGRKFIGWNLYQGCEEALSVSVQLAPEPPSELDVAFSPWSAPLGGIRGVREHLAPRSIDTRKDASATTRLLSVMCAGAAANPASPRPSWPAVRSCAERVVGVRLRPNPGGPTAPQMGV